MAQASGKRKKGKARKTISKGSQIDESALKTPSPPAARKSTLRSVLGGFVHVYFFVGVIYFFWTFALLQFRECGLFGGPCEFEHQFMSGSVVLNVITAIVPKVVVYSGLIAFGRALLWLPNLIIETLRGSFLNWLLLRDVPPMQEFLTALAEILP